MIEALDHSRLDNVDMDNVKGEEAWYRLDEGMKNFLMMLNKQKDIVGFSWDPEDPWNFGVLCTKLR